jgi:hypothetical protein
VHAPRTERAVIAVLGAERAARDLGAAVLATEGVGVGVLARGDRPRVVRVEAGARASPSVESTSHPL